MNLLKQLDQFHKTEPGLAVFALLELGLGLFSLIWAKNGGGLLAWLLCFVFLLGCIQNSVKLMEKYSRGGN